MSQQTVTAASHPMLDLVHSCLSRVLQLDYLSSGIGHLQVSTKRSVVAPPARTDRNGSSREIVKLYLRELSTRPRLSSSEEYRLASAARRGDTVARQRLIEHQLGLVVLIALRYRRRRLPLLDLIEEGNLGLMTAVEKFDAELGHRFSTYAKWWIRQSIELALMTQDSVVHVPVHVTRALKRAAKSQPSNALPTAAQVIDEDVHTLLENVSGPEQHEPQWHLDQLDERQRLMRALRLLNDKEQQVVRGRYGLEGAPEQTLAQLAAKLRVSSERVRQIQIEAIAKLEQILSADAF